MRPPTEQNNEEFEKDKKFISGSWCVQGGYGSAVRWWRKLKGPIPMGLKCLHSCDNRRCINLDHCYLGTQRENILEALDKGRWKGPSFNYQKENKPGRKLTWEEVNAIRASPKSIHELTSEFGIGERSVWYIITNKTWKENV